jgi:hypothetical protein
MTHDGLLEQRDFIAAELVRIHMTINGVPGEFRPLDLSDLSTRSRLCRGKSLAGCLDSGYHPRGVAHLNKRRGSSEPFDEVAPSQAMENGTITPEIGHGKETSYSRLRRAALVDSNSRRWKQPVQSATSDAMLDPQPADTCTT